jgi:hypothetical protein
VFKLAVLGQSAKIVLGRKLVEQRLGYPIHVESPPAGKKPLDDISRSLRFFSQPFSAIRAADSRRVGRTT